MADDGVTSSVSEASLERDIDFERKRYSTLELSRSSYDNVLARLLKRTGRFHMRPWSVLLLNFIVQYVVVYLLMQKTNGESREAALQLFRQSSDTEEEGMCLKLDAQDFPYLPSFSGLSCTPDEVMMLLDFDKIDSDGNGRWTYQEAKDLNKQYTKDMKRYLDLSQVYLSIFEKFRQNAGSQPMTPCGLGEHVEVDVSLDGMWKPGVIETMRSDSVAVVRQVYNLTLWAYDLLPEQQQGPSCASREPPCQPGEWVWVETGGKGFWGRFLFYGEVVSDHNFSEVATVHVDQRISRTSKHIRKEALLACSLPKCEDTDVGATDAVTASCSTIMQDDTKCFAEIDEDHSNHNVFGDFWPAGFEDDDDFQLMEMCCMCGGGSFDLSLTGISHLPVNLSEGDFMEAKVWRKCTQRAGSVEGRKTCNQQHTFISKAVYEAQLAPFLRYCLLPDPDLCDNLQAQGRLPAWNTTVEHFIPLFFRELGLSSLDQIDSKDICRKSITTVCPAIFPLKFGHFQYQREGQCGEKSTTVLQSGKTVSYESSEVYSDPSFGLMTFKFRLFLLLITFLWGLASIEEFRLIIVWWNVLLTLPTLTAGKPCTASMLGEDEGAFEVIGLHRRTRILAVTLNLLPRTVLQFLIFLVGIEYLLSVRSVSDLIMNSLALTFLITVDEMLFEAFGSEADANVLSQCRPLVGRTFQCIDIVLQTSHSTVGTWIFMPIMAVISAFIIGDYLMAGSVANAMYCLCDIASSADQSCYASQLFSTM